MIAGFVVISASSGASLVDKNFRRKVSCTIYSSHWSFFGGTYKRTCWIEHQPIDVFGMTISTNGTDRVQFIVINEEENVQFLPERLSETFPALRGLKVFGTSVGYLTPRNFMNLRSLEQLSMASNRIKYIDNNLFTHLSSLRLLGLQRNGIEHINSETFDSLIELEVIDLRENNLKHLDENLLVNLKKLIRITLNDNEIEELPLKFFENNVKLEYIRLAGNKIKFFDSKALVSLRNLKQIDLSAQLVIPDEDGGGPCHENKTNLVTSNDKS